MEKKPVKKKAGSSPAAKETPSSVPGKEKQTKPALKSPDSKAQAAEPKATPAPKADAVKPATVKAAAVPAPAVKPQPVAAKPAAQTAGSPKAPESKPLSPKAGDKKAAETKVEPAAKEEPAPAPVPAVPAVAKTEAVPAPEAATKTLVSGKETPAKPAGSKKTAAKRVTAASTVRKKEGLAIPETQSPAAPGEPLAEEKKASVEIPEPQSAPEKEVPVTEKNVTQEPVQEVPVEAKASPEPEAPKVQTPEETPTEIEPVAEEPVTSLVRTPENVALATVADTPAVLETAPTQPEAPAKEAETPSEPAPPTAAIKEEKPVEEAVQSEKFDGHAHLERLTSTPEVKRDPLAVLKELPFISENYNQTYLYLVPCDPKSIYVIWEVGEGARNYLREKFGPAFFDHNALILRVYDVTGIDFNGFNAHSFFEVDDFLTDKNNYWVRAQSGKNYVAELGYRALGTTFFEMVARSNTIFVPRGETQEAEIHVDWGSIHVDPNDVEITVPPDSWRFNQYLYWKRRTHAAPEEKGYWSLVLHQHLPFVRHPEYDVALEEQWFFEAVTSVYTQLLHLMWKLEREKIDFRLTVSLTPPLLSMMQNPDLKGRAWRHIDECIKLCKRERDRAWDQPQAEALSESLDRLYIAKKVFESYEGDLTRGYRDFQNAGKLEVITCAATHFLLPLYMHQPEAIRSQLQVACRQYARVFGRWPRGIWLPENAFTPGLDEFLAKEGIKWTLVSSKGMLEGSTRAFFDTSRPVISPAGTAFFGIDEETRAKIWSREHGYPGSPNYKEWYRDLGYDLPWEELPAYFQTAGVRRNTGIKYHRITGGGADLGHKEIYIPNWAKETAEIQAGQFVFERGAQATYMHDKYGRKPCIVSAYDAELFGHWWEEGPYFIEMLFKKMLYDQDVIRPVTPGEFLSEHAGHQKMTPGASSWGKSDYYQTWVEGRAFQPNTWLYRHLFRITSRMADLATQYRNTSDQLKIRALNQAARCIHLAGASDWGFLISTGQAVRYSEVQIVTHLDRAKELLRQVAENCVNPDYLSPVETADSIFPYEDMDFRVFARG